MSEDIASEIQRILKESWYDFLQYYNKLVTEYSNLWCFNEIQKKTSHWICWNEYDVMFHIGRLFYNTLSDKEGSGYSNIQIHFEKNVNISNFKEYKFASRLDELKEKLRMKRGPKIDMIVADEGNNNSFLLCSEVKYFHGPTRYESPIQQINRDIEKLKAIRECNISEKVVFILLDDYYYYTDENISKDIMYNISEIEKDEKNITILYSNTNSKLT